MGRMNIHLNEDRDKKLQRLKEKFGINSKEETIMRLIDQFQEQESEDQFDIAKETQFDVTKETDVGDLL